MTNITDWPGFSRKWLKAYWEKGADIYQERGKWIIKIPLSIKTSSKNKLALSLLKFMKKAGYQAYTHKKKGQWHIEDILNSIIWFKYLNKRLSCAFSLRVERETDLPLEDGIAWYVFVIPIRYDAPTSENKLRWIPEKNKWLHLFNR